MAPKPARKAAAAAGRMKLAKRKPNGQRQQKPNTDQQSVTTRQMGMLPSARMNALNEKDFVTLALDPCNGPLTRSPFGSTENAYIWRLNFRRVLTSNATGYFAAALNPKGAFQGTGGGSAINWWNQSSFADYTALPFAASGGAGFNGVSNLTGIAAQIRTTAGCIKLTYLGAVNAAAGELIGWEGQGDEVFTGGTALSMARNMQDLAVSGVTYPLVQGVESRLNYSKAQPTQLGYGDINVAQADVYSPMAFVGVSGGPPNAAYAVEATIILEWTPRVDIGMPAPAPIMAKPGAADRVANALRSVSPLLVSAITPLFGGYAAAVGTAVKFAGSVAAKVMA